MQFDSLSDFIQMNGHGAYVWAVYFLGFAVLLMNVLRPKMMMKQFFREEEKSLSIEATIKATITKDKDGTK